MALLTSMKNAAISNTEFGMIEAMVWQEVEDVVIEVWADAASATFVAKSGDDIFVTEDINEFNEALVYAFS